MYCTRDVILCTYSHFRTCIIHQVEWLKLFNSDSFSIDYPYWVKKLSYTIIVVAHLSLLNDESDNAQLWNDEIFKPRTHSNFQQFETTK